MRDIAQGLSLQPSSISGDLMLYADKGVLFDRVRKLLIDIESGNVLDSATGIVVEDRERKPIVITSLEDYQSYLAMHEKLRADMTAKSEQIQRDQRTDIIIRCRKRGKSFLC